jgi:hypothetical protein
MEQLDVGAHLRCGEGVHPGVPVAVSSMTRLRRSFGFGVRRTRPRRSRESTRPVTVARVTMFGSVEGAVTFTQDPSLPASMARAGVDGPPQTWIVEEADAKRY